MPSALLLLALVASPDPRAILESQCRTQAADPTNPWALAHGIVAFGPGFRARDGRRAADVIVHDFARPDPRHSGALVFPAFEGTTPVEPHPNLLLKTLVDSGLPLTERFLHAKGDVTLGALTESAEREVGLASLSKDWASSAWTLDLMAGTRSPQLATIFPAALAHLEEAQAFLGEAMDRGQASVPKQHQGIWAEPCGGLHFIQAVMTAAKDAPGRSALAPRLARQQAIVFYRLEAERPVYEAALASASPEWVVPLLAQELKFYGHWLETVGRMQREGVLPPTAAQRAQMARGRELLADTTQRLEQIGAFRNMPTYWATQHQLALDLTGDACHAVNGLALTEPRR